MLVEPKTFEIETRRRIQVSTDIYQNGWHMGRVHTLVYNDNNL